MGIFGGVVALVGEAGMTTPPFATAEEPSSAFGPGGLLAEMTIVTQRGHSAARPGRRSTERAQILFWSFPMMIRKTPEFSRNFHCFFFIENS